MYIKVLVPNKFQFKAVPTFKSLISADRNEVHYIGGADVLPPPLSAQEEAQALKKLDEDDGEAKSKAGCVHSKKIRQYRGWCGRPYINRHHRTYKSCQFL